jgi:hypothetical protein
MDNNDSSQIPPVFSSTDDLVGSNAPGLYSTPGDQPITGTQYPLDDSASDDPGFAAADGAVSQNYSFDSNPVTPADPLYTDSMAGSGKPQDGNTPQYNPMNAQMPTSQQVNADSQNQQEVGMNTAPPPEEAATKNGYESQESETYKTTKDSNAIASAISSGGNILITVNSNPTIDELSAAIGLTLALDKAEKKVTAVYGGKTPHAIAFLDPESTFQDDVSSLRDFIISLDKSKADKLKYKVDNESGTVKIFITPYKTSITSNDLDFSAGDYNVDTIIALGVKNKDDFDNSILSHGRILHDAQIITINSGNDISVLGTINYDDSESSSISEIITNIIDTLGVGLFDERVATALMTGIVASTDRFSNSKTTPKVMQVASRLMSAGANQQLISSSVSGSAISNKVTPGTISTISATDNEVVVEHVSGSEEGDGDKSESHSMEHNLGSHSDRNTPVMADPQLVSEARNQVMIEENKADAEPKKAIGLDGFMDIDQNPGDPIEQPMPSAEDTVDTSVQEKQSYQTKQIKSNDDKSTTPPDHNPNNNGLASSGSSVNIDLPPLPPMPPVFDDLNIELPPISSLKPDFMDGLTSTSHVTESANALATKRQNEAVKQDAIDAKFNSIYGEDPNRLNQ